MLRWVLFAFGLACAGSARAQGPDRGPYLADASSTSARICWRQQAAADYLCRDYQGLNPGATFFYSVDDASGTGKALPARGQELRFAAFGDSGMGNEDQKRVASQLARLDPDLVLLLGDIVYPAGEDKDYGSRYFSPYAETAAHVAFFPAVGNHDYGNHHSSAEEGERSFQTAYARIFGRPKYYSFDAGDAHFISLDTNESYHVPAAAKVGPGSGQYEWLKRDLAASTATWKFVFMHEPLYSSGHHGSSPWLQKTLEPLFSAYSVDVVFQGHDHLYERTKPIKGITYIVAGTGGGSLYNKAQSNPWTDKVVHDHGLVLATLRGKSLLLQMIDETGQERDSVRITKP